MLILCYGITKSGSTLAFEMVKGVLKGAGFKQARLPDGVVTAGHRINFVDKVDTAVVDRLLTAIPDDQKLAVKTHTSINRDTFLYLEALQAQRRVQVVASYRDPRDLCLSLVDAGVKARAIGAQPFSEFTDIASTFRAIERGLQTFRKWASITGALRLNYATVAFSPDHAIDILERALDVKCDRDEVKRHAFEDAFTQKNKAVPQRHVKELSKQDAAEIAKRFDVFIRRVCVKDSDDWFTGFRERFIAPRKEHA